MICPTCKAEGKVSHIVEASSDTTLLCCEPFYDEKGRLHDHDSNDVRTTYQCSNGHEWTEHRKQKCWCGWPDEVNPDAEPSSLEFSINEPPHLEFVGVLSSSEVRNDIRLGDDGPYGCFGCKSKDVRCYEFRRENLEPGEIGSYLTLHLCDSCAGRLAGALREKDADHAAIERVRKVIAENRDPIARTPGPAGAGGLVALHLIERALDEAEEPAPSQEVAASCPHASVRPAFDEWAARELSSHEVRERWPRFMGTCPDCGERVILYASTTHYLAGDW